MPDGGVPAPTASVLAWGEQHLRDLPWRRTRDPWAILVSEVMAQQTGVDRVVPYYRAFLERFPDPAACAAAPLGEVLRLWAGLGYNRRAVSLHRCAVAVVEHHGGTVPDRLEALLELPGIGPYTARAVLAFAFERPVGVVDTNVGRVLARWSGRPLGAGEAQQLADTLVAAASVAAAAADEAEVVAAGGRASAVGAVDGGPWGSWLWNQSVMELGAAVCGRRTPDCLRCPVTVTCTWHASGQVHPDPATGSAGVSQPQSRFEGSDRQGRGRLVDALRRGPVARAHLATVMGWPDAPARAARVAAGVVAHGLAVAGSSVLRLP